MPECLQLRWVQIWVQIWYTRWNFSYSVNTWRPRQNGRYFCRRDFHMHALGWKIWSYKYDLIEVWSFGSNWHHFSIAAHNGYGYSASTDYHHKSPETVDGYSFKKIMNKLYWCCRRYIYVWNSHLCQSCVLNSRWCLSSTRQHKTARIL